MTYATVTSSYLNDNLWSLILCEKMLPNRDMTGVIKWGLDSTMN